MCKLADCEENCLRAISCFCGIKKKTAIAMANGDEAMKGNSRSSLTDDNLAQSRKQTKKIRV